MKEKISIKDISYDKKTLTFLGYLIFLLVECKLYVFNFSIDLSLYNKSQYE